MAREHATGARRHLSRHRGRGLGPDELVAACGVSGSDGAHCHADLRPDVADARGQDTALAPARLSGIRGWTALLEPGGTRGGVWDCAAAPRAAQQFVSDCSDLSGCAVAGMVRLALAPERTGLAAVSLDGL